MISGSSIAIAMPGPEWRMSWLDGGLNSLQLDIVGFLAILGEESVKRTSHLASLSRIFCLPRLLPAPHTLLYPERPQFMERINAQVVGVQSGNTRSYVTHVTAAFFGYQMRPYEVRCISISRQVAAAQSLVESNISPPYARAALLGPVILVNLFGSLLSIALFAMSFVLGDGMSLIATILLSMLSTLVGLTNHWKFVLPRKSRLYTKEVARDMFFAPDVINYTMPQGGRFIPVSILGTLSLMLSVVALANAKIQLQIAWAGAFILLNIGHWLAAALPRRYHFRFPGHEITEVVSGVDHGVNHFTYTNALWKAICFAERTEWVDLVDGVPRSPTWTMWLQEAGAQVRKNEYLNEAGPGQSVPGGTRRRTTLDEHETAVRRTPNWDPHQAWDACQLAIEQSQERADAAER